MRRREVILGSGTVAAAALAGCLGSAQETGEDEPSGGSTRTIRVSASGEVKAEPDLAILDVAVQATGDDAESVRSELATRSEEVRNAIIEYGIDEEHVTTSRFYVRERVDRRAMERDGADPRSAEDSEEYRYYEGTHAFRVEVHDVEAAGEVVDVAVDAGADEIGRLEFTLSENRRDELRDEAITGAIEDARSEAEHVAEQIDASIVEVRTVDTSDGRVHPVREEVALAGGDGAQSTQFQPGDVTVGATVEVEFEME